MKIVTYKIKIQYNLRIMKVIPTLSFITLIFYPQVVYVKIVPAAGDICH